MSSKYFKVVAHEVPCQHIRGYYRATARSQEDALNLSVKQYVPLHCANPSKGDAVTIIAAHAAGYLKEVYEPFFDDLLLALQTANVDVRGIWIADTASHGASSVLNEGLLGNDPNWNDHARDLLYMTNVFREEMPQPIFGLGHSMGGTQIVQLALMHPRLLCGIICIEPIINKKHFGMNFSPAFPLSYRKDVWSNRQEAADEAKKSPMHKTWDKRVLDLWVTYGFRDLPTMLYSEPPQSVTKNSADLASLKPVTLATTKHHYVRSYARGAFPAPGQPLNEFEPDPRNHIDLTKAEHDEMQAPIYRPEAILTFQQLPYLRPSCLYIYGATSPFSSATPEGRMDKLTTTGTAVGGSGGASAGRVKELVLQGGGHFIVFEKPEVVAEEASHWLKSTLDDWKDEHQLNKDEWENVPLREKAMLDEEWMQWVKGFYGSKTPRAKKAPGANL